MVAIADLLGQIRQRESGGNYTLTPEQNFNFPTSHASGAYQIQPGTWRDWTRASGVGTEYAQAFQAPPAIQDQVAGFAASKYGPNNSYTWAASAPSGGYPALTSGSALDNVNAAGADNQPYSAMLPPSNIDPFSNSQTGGASLNPGFGDQTPASLQPDSASNAQGTQAGTDGINTQAWTDPSPTGSDATAPTFSYTGTAQDIPNAINQQSQEQAGSATAIAKATAAAGQAQAKAIENAASAQNKVAASDMAAALQTGSSWIANIENWGSTLFARFGFVILGSILLIFGLVMVSGKGPEIIKEAVAV